MPSVSPAAYFGVNGDTDNLLVSSPLIADISSILIKNQKKKKTKNVLSVLSSFLKDLDPSV